jgi:hypothetical protein
MFIFYRFGIIGVEWWAGPCRIKQYSCNKEAANSSAEELIIFQ